MDDFLNLMDCSLYHLWALQKISLKSMLNFLSNPAKLVLTDRQTNTQTSAGRNIYFLSTSLGGGTMLCTVDTEVPPPPP